MKEKDYEYILLPQSGELRAQIKEMDPKQLQKHIDVLTDINYHTESTYLEVILCGALTEEIEIAMLEIAKQQELDGCMEPNNINRRRNIDKIVKQRNMANLLKEHVNVILNNDTKSVAIYFYGVLIESNINYNINVLDEPIFTGSITLTFEEKFFEFDQTKLYQLINDIFCMEKHKELTIPYLIKCDIAYHKGLSIIPDALYDHIRSMAFKQLPTNEYFNAILFEDETLSSTSKKRKHRVRMQSLDKTQHNDVATFIKDIMRWVKRFEAEALRFFLSRKYDGASVTVLFENGTLTELTSRGDGMMGEILDHLIPGIIPSKVFNMDIINKYKSIEFRCEAIISKHNFNTFLKENQSNPRNAVSGILCRDKVTPELALIDFIPLDIIHAVSLSSTENFEHSRIYKDKFELLCTLGKYSKYLASTSEYDTPESCAQKLSDIMLNSAQREAYPFELDGMVLEHMTSSNNYIGKYPTTAHALKFPFTSVHTTIVNFEYRPGKSGAVTPVAVLAPVEIMGSVITYTSLSNMSNVAEKFGELRIGDVVEISKRGDIIPYMEKVVTPNPNGVLCEMPKTISIDGLDIPVTQKNRLYFIEVELSKRILSYIEAHEIQNIGEATIKKVIAVHGIKSVAEFLQLKKINIYDKESSKVNIHIEKSIKEMQNTSWEKFLLGMNIDFLGNTNTPKYMNSFSKLPQTISELIDGNPFPQNQLTYIQIKESMESARESMEEIFKVVNFSTVVIEQVVATKGKVCITGTLRIPRTEIEKILIKNGYGIASSVSKNLEFLLCGDKAGSKEDKAMQLGIEIINEDQFFAKFGGNI